MKSLKTGDLDVGKEFETNGHVLYEITAYYLIIHTCKIHYILVKYNPLTNTVTMM